jgi:hypothetical protein
MTQFGYMKNLQYPPLHLLLLLVVLRDPLVLRSGVRNLHSTQCKKLSLSSFASN